MAPLTYLLLPALAAAHFTLNEPVSVGPFDEDVESTAPCGGVSIDFSSDNVTDFHVGGEPVGLFLGHPTANWLFRATLDQTASSNWTMIYPVVAQTGLGDYCQPAVAAPSSWVGQKGILGVVADAPDGLLYQVSSTNPTSTPLPFSPLFLTSIPSVYTDISIISVPLSTSLPALGRRPQTARMPAE